MHFTIDRKRLVKMLEHVRRKMPGAKKKDKDVRIYACSARVFVEANGVTAGEEALVFRDGGCTQPMERFLMLLKSYAPKENVTIEADEQALKLFTTTLNSSGYTPDVKPPAKFFVGQVTDTWVSIVDKNMVSICKVIGKAIDKLDFVSYRGHPFDVGGFSSDILEVTNTLVFNLQPRQAAVRLELAVQCEGDTLFPGNEYGIGDKFEGFNETLNLESTFTLRFNEELPDFFEVAEVTVNNGNPLAIELPSF